MSTPRAHLPRPSPLRFAASAVHAARSLLLVPAFAVASATLPACGDDSSQVPERRPGEPAAHGSVGAMPNEATARAGEANGALPTAESTRGMAIGPVMTAAELVRAVMTLTNAADRLGLAATSTDGLGFQLVLSPETDATRAIALARALGNVTTSELAWPPAAPLFELALMNVRNGAPLHLGPSATAETITLLPDGTLFVAFLGTFAGGPSAREGENAWAYGQDSAGHAGWVHAPSLGVEEGCVLAHDTLAGALGVHLDDPQLALAQLGNMHLYRGAQRKRGTFVVTPTYVALLERPSNCRSAQLDTRITLDAPLEELHHARDREAGDTFLAIATAADPSGSDASTWGFYPPLATEPAITLELATRWTIPTRNRDVVHLAPRRGPANARGYWAFSVKHPRADAEFYLSDGETFSLPAPEGVTPSAGGEPAVPAVPAVPGAPAAPAP